MKNVFWTIVTICLFSQILFSGNLDPSGPPTSGTMKPLNEVEPRIGIPGSETPAGTYIISQSGSYYLVGNRSCTYHGIQVQADNVTIDLMGYKLTGPGKDSGGF